MGVYVIISTHERIRMLHFAFHEQHKLRNNIHTILLRRHLGPNMLLNFTSVIYMWMHMRGNSLKSYFI